MRQSLPLTSRMSVAPGVRFVSLALIACAASIPVMAQNDARIAAPDQGASATLPSDPAAAASIAVPTSGRSITRFDASASYFGQSQFQPFALSKGAGFNSPQWSSSMLAPFQPSANAGDFFGGTDSAKRFGSAAIGRRQDRFGSVFQTDGAYPRGPTGSGKEAHSESPIALPSFSALMRGNRSQPINPSLNTFKPSNQNALKLGGDAVDFTHPLGSATIINSDLGNGVLFSAGTGTGSRSIAGAPAASLGSGTPGTKHTGAAVNLNLSF
jgi:hypothetical protein